MRCVCDHDHDYHEGDVVALDDDRDGVHYARLLGPCSGCECPTFDPSYPPANGSQEGET